MDLELLDSIADFDGNIVDLALSRTNQFKPVGKSILVSTAYAGVGGLSTFYSACSALEGYIARIVSFRDDLNVDFVAEKIKQMAGVNCFSMVTIAIRSVELAQKGYPLPWE